MTTDQWRDVRRHVDAGAAASVALDQQGALRVADDLGHIIWRVRAQR